MSKFAILFFAGDVTTLIGSTMGFADGKGTNVRFNYPSGLVLATNGNIFVSDTNNHRIRRLTRKIYR